MAVTTTLDSVDKVNFEDDERLDIPDTQALQELVSETVVRYLGGLFGGARKAGDSADITVSGSLNNIFFNTAVLASTSIETKAMLLNFRQNAIGDDEGQVVWYDPDQAGAQTTIDLSAFVGLTPYIWAKRFAIPDDADTRRKWVAGAETVFSLATRQRHRVEWAVEVGDRRVSQSDNQWFIVAQVESWSGSVPTIRVWHPFDAGSPISTGLNDSWTRALSSGPYDLVSLGLNHAMHQILTTLMRHRATDGSVHPMTSFPARGLDELNTLALAQADALDDIAVTIMGVAKFQSQGTGSWAIVGAPLNLTALPVATSSGWRLDITFLAPFTTIKSAQLTVEGLNSNPVDLYAHVSGISGKTVSVNLNTMTNLAANSYDWSNVPAGSPPFGLILHVLAVQ